MILIAYDGTSSADHAIAVAGALLRGGCAHVIYVWALPADPRDAYAFAGPFAPAGAPVDDVVERQERDARTIAEAGAALARAAGFDADADAVCGPSSPAQTLEDEIDRLRPELVVIGSRRLTGFKALVKGSVSHHLGARAHAPVLIVPPVRPAGE